MKATLHSLQDKRFLCSECLDKYHGRTDEKEMLLKTRQIQACFGIEEEPRHRIAEKGMVLHFSTCIGNFFSHSAMDLIEKYDLFEKGVMVYPGSMSEQPSKIFDVMRVIKAHKLRQMEKAQEKQDKKTKAQMRGTRGKAIH